MCQVKIADADGQIFSEKTVENTAENSSEWTVMEEGRILKILNRKGDGYSFHTIRGNLCGIWKNGKNMLLDEMHLSVWRAPTDNERHLKTSWGLFEDNMSGWNMNRSFDKCYEMSWEKMENGITVKKQGSLAGVSRSPFLKYQTVYHIDKAGVLHVRVSAEVNEKTIWLPRLGFELTLPYEMEDVSYYGKGPYENYQDMCHHVRVGKYNSTVSAEYVPYVKPQEHGNHTCVKYLKLSDAEKENVLEVAAEHEIEFGVSHYTQEELTEKKHHFELEESNTNLRIDYKSSGIGSASCGPDLLEKYRLSEKKIQFGFLVR